MILKTSYNKSQMTLALAIHNNKDIILAADSLSIQTFALNGKTIKDKQAKKIYKIDNHSAIAIAGKFDTHVVETFLTTFLHFVSGLNLDVDSLRDTFWNAILESTYFEPGDSLCVIIAGYTKDGQPKFYCLNRVHNGINELVPMSDKYEIIGYSKPKDYIKELIESKAINMDTKTWLIKKSLAKHVKNSIKEFPDLLDGKPQTIILKKPN